MERAQLFYRYKAVFWEKLNGWLLVGEEIYDTKLVSNRKTT